MSLPEEFRMPLTDARGHILTAGPANRGAVRPVFGTVEGQYVKFFTLSLYNKSASEKMGYEVLDEVEMVEVINDRQTKCHLKVSTLAKWQREAWAEVYDRFKRQIESIGTAIEDWVAISDHQKALLAHCNILSVEQCASLSPEGKAKLGPDGAEICKKAQEHLKVKEGRIKAEEKQKEIDILRQELEAQAAKHQKDMEDMFARLAAKVAGEKLKKKPGRKAKVVDTIEVVQNEKAA